MIDKMILQAIATALLLGSLVACGGQGNGPFLVPPATTAAPASAAASAPAGGAAAPTTSPTPTVKDQIAALERSGAYPALARSSDIAGPDANKNGVRDDIEAWINSLQVNDAQRKALMQDARATQRALVVDLKDQAALQSADEGFAASMKCGAANFSNYADFSKLAGRIEALTANNRERTARHMQFATARSRSSTTRPSGNTCEP